MTIFSNMGLEAPDVGDSDYPTDVTNSFELIDEHDHTSGKGVQIPTGGIENLAITAGKIASDAVTTAKILNLNVTTGKIADAAVTTVKILDANVTKAKLAALGQQISSTCGTYTSSSTSPADVTNLSVTITTIGRPVWVGLQPDSAATAPLDVLNGSWLQITGGGSGNIGFLRDAVLVLSSRVDSNFVPPGCIWIVDVPTAGTYTYKAQVIVTSGTMNVRKCKLVAYEL